MSQEQVEWAVKGGADYIIAETFLDLEEAKMALEVIQKFGQGLSLLEFTVRKVEFLRYEYLAGKSIFQSITNQLVSFSVSQIIGGQ